MVGAFWGILIIVFAALLRSSPEGHVGYGVGIIIFAILSWFGAFGGFGLGFLLSLIGGIMAITWNPREASINVTMTAGTIPAPGPIPQASAATRFCPRCGAPVEMGARFCRSCGGSL